MHKLLIRILPAGFALACLFLAPAACNTPPAGENPGSKPEADSQMLVKHTVISEVRDSVAKTPVAVYAERTDNPLNDWYFRVKLYQTPKTFYYRMQLEFEEIRGEDTIKFPNFGMAPMPVIRKGPEKYSCIVGFLDKDSSFREYKKVYVKNDVLKVTALKHYAVYPKSALDKPQD